MVMQHTSEPLAFRSARSRPLSRERSCRAMLARSYELRFSEPAEMLRTARLAAGLAEGCRGLPLDAWADLRAEAWAHLGNAAKVMGDYQAAEGAFRVSRDFWSKGTRDQRLEAQRLQFLAALRMRESRLGEAKEILGRACEILRQTGDKIGLAEAMIQLALAKHEDGHSADALRLVIEVNRLVNVREHPRLALISRHNGALFLIALGRPNGAVRELVRTEPLARQVGDEILLFRRDWLRARICACRPEMDGAAETRFRHSLAEAQRLELLYEAAKVALELAHFMAIRGRAVEIGGLLDTILPIFEALGIGRESVAVRLLRRASRRQACAVALLVQAVAAIETAPIARRG